MRALWIAAVWLTSACVLSTPIPSPSSTSPIQTGAHAFDAEDLRAAALPKADLEPAYASYVFDWYFAGFESNEERARDKSPNRSQELRNLTDSGRLVGYQEMYVPPRQTTSGVSRIFTLVGIFKDAAGASRYLAQQSPASGASFPVTGMGDEVAGFRTLSVPETLTRVYVRRGPLLGTVGINRRDQNDVNQEAIELARKLDDRLMRSLSGALRGYRGAPGGEIGAERVQLMALPLADLGADYTTFTEEIDTSGFQDNDEWAQLTSIDPADAQEFDRDGRVTGFFQAFIPYPPGHDYVRTGAHLFRDQAGATDFLAGFAVREKNLVGAPIGDTTIERVDALSVSSIGEQAAAVSYTLSNGMRRVTVLIRRGRVVAEATVLRQDGARAQAEALAFARKLDDRLAKVLAGSTP